MPTVEKFKGYRFFFFSNEGHEPPHIHVESAEKYGKFWLEPVILARSAAHSILLVMERSADMRELLEALALLNRHDTSVPIFGLADFGPACVEPPAV